MRVFKRCAALGLTDAHDLRQQAVREIVHIALRRGSKMSPQGISREEAARILEKRKVYYSFFLFDT